MNNFFHTQNKVNPIIYGYSELSDEYQGLIKIGYTERPLSERMSEHYPTRGPEQIQRYKVLIEEAAIREDGSTFKDYEVHKILKNAGVENVGGEWFRCKIEDIKAAIIACRNNTSIDFNRVLDFKLRPEQSEAIKITKKYFKSYKHFERKTPHFLWNCKMRFGKTFTSYKLAQSMDWKKVLILTFKPSVENSWREDLESHKDFANWQFISKNTRSYDEIDSKKPFVCFASFQDFLGKSKIGGIKVKNKWAHKVKWDCIILDEYHYGAWRDTARELYEAEDKNEQKESSVIGVEDWDEDISPLKTNHYLYLSGTPFRAISSGEFIEEQIYNWTYIDEQNSKLNWKGSNNPYLSLPRMVMMTYQMPESLSNITDTGEFDEFDLNEFFKASGEGEKAVFKHENYVQQWLNLIRGNDFKNMYNNLKLGNNKPVLPFADSRLLNILNHTFWFLPSVASCFAMRNLMMKSSNYFYQAYEVIVCASKKAGIGVKSLIPVRKKMANPIKSKTITLSCGKLTTGVTVKPWTGVFMLRNTTSPETYFQTAFRAQSPWTIDLEGNNDNQQIIKKECYVFDFAPNRTLKLITDYSCRLNVEDKYPELKVDEFINFLPVLCFDGTSMRQINAQEVLDFGMVGTTGNQLAKKFDSDRLVHVDDTTLLKLMNNEQAMEVLMKIEGFRNINQDIEKIINKSEKIKNIKKSEDEDDDTTKKNKKELTQEEKEVKNKRKIIRDNLKKFATRIPVFMYLTDYREETLKDVITQLEPKLFKKVTSLSVKEFELLLSLGLFNSSLMNEAIFAFKRYENASLHYEGLSRHEPKSIGLFDTKISSEEFYSS